MVGVVNDASFHRSRNTVTSTLMECSRTSYPDSYREV